MNVNMQAVKTMLLKEYGAIKPHFRPGDSVDVFFNIINKGKHVEKKVSGVCLRVTSSSFLIKTENNAEYNFSLFMPTRVEIVRCGRVRQGRIYYLRDVSGKKARIKTDIKRDLKKSALNSAAKEVK